MVAELWFLSGYNSTDWVKWSATTIQYRNPWELNGYFTISIVTNSPGRLMIIDCSGALLAATTFFLPLAWQAVPASFPYVRRHLRPDILSLTQTEILAVFKMAQVIVPRLKNPRCKNWGNSYLSWATILNANAPKGTFLPHTQVWPLLNKKPELNVVYIFCRGNFGRQ